MISVMTGFLAGALHVYSGPDHLAAVAPLTVDGRGRSWTTGLRWGLGHAGGVLLVGALSLALREVLPVESLSAWAERLVGVVLIAIGLWGLRKAQARHVHTHAHAHDGTAHVHVHVHSNGTAHDHAEGGRHAHTHAALAVGTLHGLAGSSHFLGVLPALAFPSQIEAVAYLVSFGLGTILAMVSFASILGWLAGSLRLQGANAYRGLMTVTSSAAVLVGAWWLVV